ncbi:hypothetical protein KSP40_PGU020033 [Platanthera guangdongensis]|uniref:Uncharacterized protein n=1 Tax=Platanthera guangdongensis TaxID=2320717 RepID=A0ABR2MG33_9ASPA
MMFYHLKDLYHIIIDSRSHKSLRLRLFGRFRRAFGANAAGRRVNKWGAGGVCSRRKKKKPRKRRFFNPASPLLFQLYISASREQTPLPHQMKLKALFDVAVVCERPTSNFYILRKEVSVVAERVEEVRDATGLERLQANLSALQRKAADSSLWDDPPKAQEILLGSIHKR